MTMTPEEKSAVRTRLLTTGFVALVVGGLICAGIEKLKLAEEHKRMLLRDTPVVLVGGSVDFDTDNDTRTWTPEGVAGGYYATGGKTVGTISIRNPQEGQKINVETEDKKWEVTINSDGVDTVKVSQDLNDPKIHVVPIEGSGPLNPKSKPKPPGARLHYHRKGMSCPAGGNECDRLMTVRIKVNDIALGVFNCVDSASTPGRCKVHFIEKD